MLQLQRVPCSCSSEALEWRGRWRRAGMALGKARAAGRDGDAVSLGFVALVEQAQLGCAAMQQSLSAPKWCRCGAESSLQPPCSLPVLLTPSFSDGLWQVPGPRQMLSQAESSVGECADPGCGTRQEHRGVQGTTAEVCWGFTCAPL